MANNYHESVMVKEAIDGLHINKGSLYIDGTLGNGGHTLAILEAGGKVLGIELDPKMLEVAESRIKGEGIDPENYRLVNGNFIEIDKIAKENEWNPVSGIILDLGVSNIHLKDLERGFSFENSEAPLDMRLDPKTQGVSGADLLNVLREDQLRQMFEVTLDPGAAKWITGRVLHSRDQKPIAKVGDLLEVAEGLKTGKHGLNEATLPFLALRIAVNSELMNLRGVLPKAFDLLEEKGRLVVISFHSGEDEIVKDFFKGKAKEGAKLITLKPIVANEAEIEKNKRARSAKIRIIEK